MKFNVMFVDNSMSVLESLQWAFMDEPYYIFTFDNPFDALKVIRSLEWAVVVVDRLIPKMGGLEFLNRVLTVSPHTIGIILTDENKIAGELNSLYSKRVYRFIKKPLNVNEIKKTVKTAIAHYETKIGSKERLTMR